MKRCIQAAAFIWVTLAVSAAVPAQERMSADQASLARLEQQWLASAHDAATLQRILGEDFVHPVAAGVFLTKRQHIEWAAAHPAPPNRRQQFDQMRIRIYGDVGIVTGMVVSTQTGGREDRTVFTDVFVRRNNRWHAVNAQENVVQAGNR